MFSDDLAAEQSVSGRAAGGSTPGANSVDEVTLAIDIAEVKKRKARRRLKHSSDFSYLLDALIYHLRVQEDRPVEELDRFGRNEEEQIGADDDEDLEPTRRIREHQDEMLQLCHSKIRIVVNRMTAQLRAYADGKQSLEQVLIRLLGVLAVLRELRTCDGRVTWVEKGKTTVPRQLRTKLFEEAMYALFEGKESLLHLEALDELQDSDDVARLKGLLLWLAWDCGLTVDLSKPFMETREKSETRLRGNAMMLALAQSIQSDDVVIDEARQSIGSYSAGEFDWLEELTNLAIECRTLKDGAKELQPAEAAQPGDVAVHKSIQDWDLRVVVGSDGGYVSLIRLGREKDRITFMPRHLGVTQLAAFRDSS